MYGKVFESLYQGSLYGDWKAIITMQQLIVIADSAGIVDMTPQAISGMTSIPIDIIEAGIDALSRPDPDSRTDGHDGVRISPLDNHRSWGWFLVNYDKYKNMRSNEDRREYMKLYMAEKRAKEKKPANKTSRAFKAPTIPEVQAYLDEKGITTFTAERFVSHYASANWMRGKTKITNWKYCVGTWMKDTKKKSNPLQGCI